VGYQNNHAKKYVQRMRAFVEAVLAYTNASQVNVIGHSMGVSIGRKIIKGGNA
jgi:triacylglycerol lipase